MRITLRQSSLLKGAVLLSAVPFGSPVYVPKTKKFIMKLKPTGFLLNSTIVSDVLARGDCFVCDLKEGTVYAKEGKTEVLPIKSELLWDEA